MSHDQDFVPQDELEKQLWAELRFVLKRARFTKSQRKRYAGWVRSELERRRRILSGTETSVDIIVGNQQVVLRG